jgi:Immunity protein 8
VSCGLSSSISFGSGYLRTRSSASLSLHIWGPAGSEGADLFEVTVCTRGWLRNVSKPKGYAFLRHHLVVERWDEELGKRAFSDLCLRNEGEDWNEVATKLSRYLYWEFEDYRDP